jgi:hypothetical protein
MKQLIRLPIDEVALAETEVLLLAERWNRLWTGSIDETYEAACELAEAVKRMRRARKKAQKAVYST